jgi:hypothetical protein
MHAGKFKQSTKKTLFCWGFGLLSNTFRNLPRAADDVDSNELN